jgi:hypothetical protein
LTTQNTESTPAVPEPGSLEAEIASAISSVEATTSPEEVAATDAAMSEDGALAVDPAAAPEPEATPEPEAVAAEPSVETPEPIQESAQPVETEVQPEEPAARTFTQDEWSKRESAYRTQQAQAEQRLAALEQQSAASQVDQQVEALAQRVEANLTPTYGAEEAARIARDPSTIQELRDGLYAKSENVQLRQALLQSGQQNESQAKASTIQHFATLHNVADADRPLLETAGSPEQMETLARRLAQPAARAAAPRVESKVPAGSVGRLETGESEAPPLDDDARESAINAKNPADWTEEDIAFQNRRY